MRLYLAVLAIILCIVVLCLSTSTGQDRKKYEIDAQVYSVPAYQSDAAHAVDAYGRLMQRYTDLTERTMAGIATDLNGLVRRLDAIDARLTALDTRLARIEQHLCPASVSAPSPIPPLGQGPSTVKPTSNHPDMKNSAPIADPPPVPVPPTCNSSPASDAMQ